MCLEVYYTITVEVSHALITGEEAERGLTAAYTRALENVTSD